MADSDAGTHQGGASGTIGSAAGAAGDANAGYGGAAGTGSRPDSGAAGTGGAAGVEFSGCGGAAGDEFGNAGITGGTAGTFDLGTAGFAAGSGVAGGDEPPCTPEQHGDSDGTVPVRDSCGNRCVDNNPCTIDYCDSHDVCHHDTFGPNCSNFYRDQDFDGNGSSCSMNQDCDDGDPLTYGGQDEYFTTPRVRGPGLVSFDYDCDDMASPLYTAISSGCKFRDDTSGPCVGGGWILEANDGLPSCGNLGHYATCVIINGDCVKQEMDLRQACH